MDKIEVFCPRFRSGIVQISGFKHSMVSVLAACLAARGTVTLRNTPDILERAVFIRILEELGCAVQLRGTRLNVDCTEIVRSAVHCEQSRLIHGSLYLVAALTGAIGRGEILESGGCAIGDAENGRRPTKHIAKVLSLFGAECYCTKSGGITSLCEGLVPTDINIMDFSVRRDLLTGPHISGATKAALICAAAVQSAESTVIRNPYPKPDMRDCLRYLCSAGFSVCEEPNRISIARANSLPVAVDMHLTPDLSEVMTYITMAILTRSPFTARAYGMDLAVAGLAAELDLLNKMGIQLEHGPNHISVLATTGIRSVDIEVTSVGIYSDHQPLFALLLTQGHRPATIQDFVWKSRFAYADGLRRFGAKIETIDHGIKVTPSRLTAPAGEVRAEDLRMAAVLMIASIMVEGPVTLTDMGHLDRGYTSFLAKLSAMGVQFKELT